MRWVLLLLSVVSWRLLLAQVDTVRVPNSTNGWYLSPHGTIRVLLLFAEIDWDRNPSLDPQPEAGDGWPKGQLPRWKDDVFDPHPAAAYLGQVTRYYHDMSLGRYAVLGDYIDTILTLRESAYPGVGNAHGLGALAVQEANKLGALRTHNRLSIADFDLWRRGGKAGMPKQAGADDPHSYDHVMVIVRNSGLTHNQGSVDPGSPGKLFGFESDSQSRFGGMYGMPFEILQHEFNHLLFGGNNFHTGGGNAAQFTSYFPFLQGGWSMMGGSNSSLLTGNAWDRDRLGWRAADAKHRINARDANGASRSGDIDPYNGDTGLYVLRDFMTSGDALRIRLPFIPENEYPQWIWLENHQTYKRNGVLCDKFHYEVEMPCVAGAVPGIYAYVQVDRDNRYGDDVFGQYSDYLRPVLASGHFDQALRDERMRYECLWGNETRPYDVSQRSANALTGNMEQEMPLAGPDKSGKLNRSTHYVPRIEFRDGVKNDQGIMFGHARHAFTPGHKLGMCTNPSTANMLTVLNNQGNAINKYAAPDNRTIHLNGIGIEVMEQRANGDIVLRVGNNDRVLDHDIRWCGDSIVLHPPPYAGMPALTIATGARLLIDRSGTPTVLTRVGEAEGGYSYPTRLVVVGGSTVIGEARCEVELRAGSELHVMPGAHVLLHRKAKLDVGNRCLVVLHGNAELKARPKALRRLKKKGRVVSVPQ